MDRPRFGLSVLLVCWFAAIASGQAFGQPLDRPRTGDRPRFKIYGRYQPSTQSRSHFVGVMGAVGTAGVFEIPAARVALTSVIERAGGLSDDASQMVRVIRGGRVVFRSFLMKRLPEQVSAGDLIVVHRRRQNRANGTRRSVDGSVPDDGATLGVEIAIVNVLDRPVVLRIRREHATVAAMVSLLGQNSDAASDVRVVSTVRSRRSAESNRLLEGSILVFDRSTVQRNRVPALLQPILLPRNAVRDGIPQAEPQRRFEDRNGPARYQRSPGSRIIRTGGIATRESQPFGDEPVPSETGLRQLRELNKRNVKSLIASARRDLVAGRLYEAQRKALHAEQADIEYNLLDDRPSLVLAAVEKAARAKRPASARNDTVSSNTRAPGQKNAASANAPESLTPRLTDSMRTAAATTAIGTPKTAASRLPQFPRTLESQPPSNGADSSDAISARMQKEMKQSDRAEVDALIAASVDEAATAASEAGESSWYWVRAVLAVLAVAVIFVVSWKLMSIGRTAPSEKAAPAGTAAATVLDRLIRNELPLQEETPEFPTAIEVLRETPSVARFDPVQPPEAMLRPHFQPRVAPDVKEPAPAPVSEVVSPPVGPVTEPAVVVDSEQSVPPPKPRTLNRLKSSDALGRALSALRETTAPEGRTA